VENIDAEIIVVDGGSNDSTVKIAEKPGATVVKSTKGRSLQMNAGASASSGNNLLFLHADTIVPENYISLIFEAILDKRPVAGAFRFKTDMDNTLMRFVEYAANLRSRYLKPPYGDQGIFISKGNFNRAGGYPKVPVAEDIYLIRNLKKFAAIKILPETAVVSARRWRKHGFLKTTFVNVVIFFWVLPGSKAGEIICPLLMGMVQVIHIVWYEIPLSLVGADLSVNTVDLRKISRYGDLIVIPAQAGIHFKYLKTKAK
jgi:hypothetical protein